MRDSFRRPVVARYFGYVFQQRDGEREASGFIALAGRQLKKARYQYRLLKQAFGTPAP